MDILIGVAFAAILAALAWAGVAMLRGGRDRRNDSSRNGAMMRALAIRVAISVLLFACILIAWALGWIHPTGLPLSH
jgi:CHASE2 domain-containing sensor protein